MKAKPSTPTPMPVDVMPATPDFRKSLSVHVASPGAQRLHHLDLPRLKIRRRVWIWANQLLLDTSNTFGLEVRVRFLRGGNLALELPISVGIAQIGISFTSQGVHANNVQSYGSGLGVARATDSGGNQCDATALALNIDADVVEYWLDVFTIGAASGVFLGLAVLSEDP